jgi:TetR/AcrR family transcriptional regulator of autoinduction and epiphytic fitness
MQQALTISEQKREAILAAALREFEANGFRETSMDRVAASAQVSKRTVYNHFSSKQALFDAIAVRLVEHARHGSDLPYDPAAAVGAQLGRIAAQVLDLFTSPAFASLARVTLVELIRSPELGRQTHELFRRSQTGLAHWLEAAEADGRLSVGDPVWAADQFLGLIKSFALWPQLLGGQPPPDAATRDRIIRTTVAMFLGAYPPRAA